MTKLIVFTDLHMVPEGTKIIGLDPYQRLLAGIEHVNRHHADANRVIFTGDLTHRADTMSYERLRDLLSLLVPPAAITIGNHDYRERFLETFAHVAPDEDGFVQQVIDFDDCRVVLLDTLFAPPYDYPRSHAGYLCERRLAWLDRMLADANGLPVLLFMHHPPHKTGFTGMDAIRLGNEDAFYDLVLKHGNAPHLRRPCAPHDRRLASRHSLLHLQEPRPPAADALRHAERLALGGRACRLRHRRGDGRGPAGAPRGL